MKEFIEKLIGRLEEESNKYLSEDRGYICRVFANTVEIVNEVAEEYINTSTDTSTECNEALDSLHKKILKSKFAEEVTEAEIEALVEVKNNGWIPCWERLPEENIEVDVTIEEIDGSTYTKTSWLQEGQWVVKKSPTKPTVIAWKERPAPYQPKGCDSNA